MNKNNLLSFGIIAGVGGAGYYLYNLNNTDDNKNNNNQNSNFGSSGTTKGTQSKQSISNTGLTKKQVNFITQTLDNTEEQTPTKINTFDINTTSNGVKHSSSRTTITTNKKNIKAVESLKSIGINSGTNTTFIYTKKSNNVAIPIHNGVVGKQVNIPSSSVIGGTSFSRRQSLTKKASKNIEKTKNNPFVSIFGGY